MFILAFLSLPLYHSTTLPLLQAAAFESSGLGARPLALGNSYVSVPGSYESVFWNPAGISTLRRRTFHSEYRNLYGMGILRYITAGYVHPGVGRGALGFSWLRMDTMGDASFLDYAENTLIVSYGSRIVERLHGGVNAKYYRVHSTVGAGGMGLDLGLTYNRWGVNAGAAVSDVTRSEISWDSGAKDRIPRTVRIGLSGYPLHNTLLTGQAAWKGSDRGTHHAGVEQMMFDQMFGLRLGITEQSGEWRFAWGFGVRAKIVTLDYAWERQRLLGDTQVFSASVRF